MIPTVQIVNIEDVFIQTYQLWIRVHKDKDNQEIEREKIILIQDMVIHILMLCYENKNKALKDIDDDHKHSIKEFFRFLNENLNVFFLLHI